VSDSASARRADEDQTPDEIPDFDLIRPIGQGGFGRVWLATNRTTGHLRAAMLMIAGVVFWTSRPSRVYVNFVTYPFEARICLDGKELGRTDGTPYRTPCTVEHLPARVHHVVFKHDERDDLDEGPVDFAQTRQVVGRWFAEPSRRHPD